MTAAPDLYGRLIADGDCLIVDLMGLEDPEAVIVALWISEPICYSDGTVWRSVQAQFEDGTCFNGTVPLAYVNGNFYYDYGDRKIVSIYLHATPPIHSL